MTTAEKKEQRDQKREVRRKLDRWVAIGRQAVSFQCWKCKGITPVDEAIFLGNGYVICAAHGTVSQ